MFPVRRPTITDLACRLKHTWRYCDRKNGQMSFCSLSRSSVVCIMARNAWLSQCSLIVMRCTVWPTIYL